MSKINNNTVHYLRKAIGAHYEYTRTVGSNTTVTCYKGNAFVRLHGNLIATVHENRVVLSTCGWLTRTTLSRINAIGAAFAKDFEPWRIRNGALYISNRGNAQNVHIQVYQLKESNMSKTV